MLTALMVTTAAGLATSIGGVIGTHPKMQRKSWLAVALAFSAGAMLLVTFMELLPLGIESLAEAYGDTAGQLYAYLAFFVGMGVVLLIDLGLPKSMNPSEITGREAELSESEARTNAKLIRSGLLVAVALAMHNFPEGIATFAAAYSDLSVGLTLAIAIAIHNIPEGIAVAAPVYAATKSRSKAFWWATLSGLTEPLGALVAALLIASVIPASFMGVLYALVAGMMVFVAIDELIPAAIRYQTRNHQSIYGCVAGMAVMAVSLLMLGE